MENTITMETETLKKSIEDVPQRSKERIESIIGSNTKQLNLAIAATERTFTQISKMLYENEMDPSIVSSLKTAFGKCIELSEETIDWVIGSHTNRIDLSIDLATKFMEIVKSEDLATSGGRNKLIELMQENAEKSAELSVHNMEKIMAVYNDHLNYALNFNKKLTDHINSKIMHMFELQKKSMDSLFDMDMATKWWKNMCEEIVEV